MKILTPEELRQALEHPVFHLIGEAADEQGMECYVIGGYVRDLFLQRPSADIDCVVVGSGIRMAEAVAAKVQQRSGRKPHVAVYANFGTAQIRAGRLELEFVGARRESYQHDSRKPIVEDGTLEDDQNRRDFTINAMALCLNAGRYGELVDPFGGIDDLQDGIIRTPLDPDITFSDDPLRMMRCVRFATQLNFRIDDETFEALGRNASRLSIISGERTIEELNKIMLAPHPSKGLIELDRCGLLALILPEITALQGVQTVNGRAHKDNFYHTLAVLENLVSAQEARERMAADAAAAADSATPPPAGNDGDGSGLSPDDRKLYLRWATLLHDIGKPRTKRWDAALGWTFHNHDYVGQKMVAQLFRRLKLPTDERMKYVAKLVGLHMRPAAIADAEVTDSAVRRLLSDAGDDIDDLMMLCEADITSKNEVKKARILENFRMVREKLDDLKARDYKRLFQPVVDGDDIMRLFGLKPSREVGLLKTALKNAVLDEQIPNERAAAVAFLKAEGEKIGLKILESGE